jgi:hypothetical protein
MLRSPPQRLLHAGDNFSGILRFSMIFIRVLIGSALLWPINGCSPEASIACETSTDQQTFFASCLPLALTIFD